LKAIICSSYGGPEVLRLADIDKPAPADNEVLVRVAASAVNTGDVRLRKADPWAVRLFFGFLRPRKPVPGAVLSGEIETVGKNVTRFKVGDAVFGSAGMHLGAHAEFISLPEDGLLVQKPLNVSHTEAATLTFGGLTALHFIRKANVSQGMQVLIYGASGSVGTAAVQLAKFYGATVTAVCSGRNVELVRSLGADRVIDYTLEDFTDRSETYDVLFETVDKLPIAKCFKSLKSGGTLILGAALLGGIIKSKWQARSGNHKVLFGPFKETSRNISFLADLVKQGAYKPVVDRTYTLEQMSEAHRYVEEGHKRGNVAIAVT
jgi:NADPH:quinone reductase-like Zn-dependent oxidoreductase